MSLPARYVLVVDDEVLTLERVVHELHEAGFTPRLATTTGEALADVDAQPPPVCALLSLGSAGIDPGAVVARIKAHPLWAPVPLVLVAPADAPELPGHIPVEGVVTKPPAPGAVARLVGALGARRAAEADPPGGGALHAGA